MKTRAAFTKSDVKRAISATEAAGLEVRRVEIEPATGKIVIVTGRPGEAPAANDDGWGDFDAQAENAVCSRV